MPGRLGAPVLALVFACAGNAPTAVSPGTEFQLAPGETAAVRETPLTITFRSVAEDSRCPIDVVCIRAGNARVRLEVRENGTAHEVALNTGEEPRSAVFANLTVHLTSLLPAPRAAAPTAPGAYRAGFRVVRE